MPKRHLIIGGGPAGIYALEAIRELEEESAITLISDEPAYSRMALPYYMAGEIDEEHLLMADERYFETMRVEAIIGKRVKSIDPKGNQVTLDDGRTIQYDDLLIATGSSANRLPIPGADLPGVLNLWTLADAKGALERARPGAKVVFIGAGFIGFIILNALFKLGCHISVVELEEQVLPRMVDAQAGALVREWLRRKGVEVITGCSVSEIGQMADGRKSLRLSDGRALTADLVIVATGITANTELARGCGIQVNQGILVNESLQTNFPNIYSAGDVAEGPDILGGRAVHAIQPTAEEHGRIAGANMAGKEVRYPGSLLMNILDVVGLQCNSFGIWKEDGREVTTRANVSRPIYRKLVWEEDRIVGAILIGPADDAGVLNDLGMVKGLIQTRTPLGKWKEHLVKNPLDIRRAYVASKVAARLLDMKLTGRPSKERRFRYMNLMPETRPTEAHKILISTRPN